MFLLLTTAFAGSYDSLEIGGLWGSPTANGGEAPWWNPAGMAMDSGFRASGELAYSWGNNRFERTGANPGTSEMGGGSPVPFVGLVHTFPSNFALGASLTVPYATGGNEAYRGSNAYFSRRGSIVAAYGILSAAYAPSDRISFGLSLAGVSNTMSSISDLDTVPDLHTSIADMGEESPYTDADLEQEAYSAIIELKDMSYTTATVGGGVQAWITPNVLFGASFWRGYDVVQSGDITMHFKCPPEADTVGRFGAESRGICHAAIDGNVTSSYTIPHRASGGLTFFPQPWTRVEVMGGWVGWSVQQDLVVDITNVAANNPEMDPTAAALMERKTVMARDLNDSFWGGVDVKHELPNERVLLGGRVLYDSAAVPTDSMNPSNADFNQFLLSGPVAFHNGGAWQLSFSATHHVQQSRTVTNSRYSMTLDPQRMPEERYQAPSANGTYSAQRDKVGATLRVRF